LQALDFPGEMIAVVHDDHVFSSRLGGRRTETCQKGSKEKNAIRAEKQKNSNSHFLDSYK
jgi:hypothetical protein